MNARYRLPTIALCSAAALVLAACASPQGGEARAGWTESCVKGAAIGALVGVLASGGDQRKAKEYLIRGVAGGCAVGLAATAVGKVMDARQQARHEEAMQREARRLALEQQNLAAIQARHEAMPAATAQQRAARDASLEKARADWQANYTRPVTVDLGDGGTSVIQPQAPKEAPKAGNAPACFDQTVLVRTARGQAKQVETWCPNGSGQLVRAEARAADV